MFFLRLNCTCFTTYKASFLEIKTWDRAIITKKHEELVKHIYKKNGLFPVAGHIWLELSPSFCTFSGNEQSFFLNSMHRSNKYNRSIYQNHYKFYYEIHLLFLDCIVEWYFSELHKTLLFHMFLLIFYLMYFGKAFIAECIIYFIPEFFQKHDISNKYFIYMIYFKNLRQRLAEI